MELKSKLQHRVAFQPSGLLMRKEEDVEMLEGVAIVVNQETILYEGSDWREIEVIDPSCIAMDFINGQDIKLNLLHERNYCFARWIKGERGTLILESREDGLAFRAPKPDCDLGQRAKALVENETYTGCSFEFWAKDYEVSERKGADGKNEYVIRHTAFEKIGAITIGMDPAYEQTSVNARELYREMHEVQEREEAQEHEDLEKAQREAEESARMEREQKITRERALSAMQREVEIEEMYAIYR